VTKVTAYEILQESTRLGITIP